MKIEIKDMPSLEHAALDASTFLHLIQEERIPEPLIGWMIVIMNLRFLRAVFGVTNEQVPYKLMEYLDNFKEELEEIMEEEDGEV